MQVEVTDKAVKITDGLWPMKKHQVIPVRNIASIAIAKFTKKVVIITNDKHAHAMAFGSEKKANEVLEAILEIM